MLCNGGPRSNVSLKIFHVFIVKAIFHMSKSFFKLFYFQFVIMNQKKSVGLLIPSFLNAGTTKLPRQYLLNQSQQWKNHNNV